MASSKLFGCPLNTEAEEEDDDSTRRRRWFENIPYFPFSDSESASMDSDPDLHNCFIDFFYRKSLYEVETDGEFFISPNQRLSTLDDLNIWRYNDSEEEIELGLGIGFGSESGSGQLCSDSGEVGLDVTWNRETESGRVEIKTHVGDDDDLFCEEEEEEAMVADEVMEWVDLQNSITWVQEPVQVSLFGLEEEEEEEELTLADLDWQVYLPVNNVGVFEESEDIFVNYGVMDSDHGVLGVSLEEYGEIHGDDEYDVFSGAGIALNPPASKRAVEELLVVKITEEEVSNGDIFCAICKDEIVVEDKVKRLPCRHYYHGECIVPWLEIRNTCPVCRYELPTDDLDYERFKTSQGRGSTASGLVSDLMSE